MDKIIISMDKVAMTYDVEFEGAVGYSRGQAMLITAITRMFKDATGCDKTERLRLAQALLATIQQFGKEESEMSDPTNGDNKLGERKGRLIIDVDEPDGNGDVHFEGRIGYTSSVCALISTVAGLVAEAAKCDEDEGIRLAETLLDAVKEFEEKHGVDKSVLRVIE